jgi:hypothetical protein
MDDEIGRGSVRVQVRALNHYNISALNVRCRVYQRRYKMFQTKSGKETKKAKVWSRDKKARGEGV